MGKMLIVWLVVLILAIVLELISLGLTTIWFAGGAIIAAIAAGLNAPIVVQIVLFLIVSLVLLFFTRPIAVQYFNKDRVKTNAESLIGKQAVVTAEINNLQNVGVATVNGQEWSARSISDTLVIPEGSVVEIVEISGVKLIVR